MTDWAKKGLTEEVVVVIVKPTPDSKLGVTLSSFPEDVPHPRVTGAYPSPHCAVLPQQQGISPPSFHTPCPLDGAFAFTVCTRCGSDEGWRPCCCLWQGAH